MFPVSDDYFHLPGTQYQPCFVSFQYPGRHFARGCGAGCQRPGTQK
jgi:hypothetical protein